MAGKQYKFKTNKERALTAGSTLAGVAIFGGTLAAAFNPVAIGAVGIFAAGTVGLHLLMTVPGFRKQAFGRMKAVPEGERIYRISKEISDSLGRPEAPKIYLIDRKTVARMKWPLGMRWKARTKKGRKTIEEYMPKVFGAMPGMNTFATTKEALAANYTDAQLRFIIAHEMSHLKTDFSPGSYAAPIVQKAFMPLLLATGAAAALSAVGVGVPALAGIAAWKAAAALAGAKVASKPFFSFMSRVREKRADRNALYITRDLKAAEDTMNALHHKPEHRKRQPLRKEIMRSHPSYTRRMAALKKAFAKVSKYPVLQSATPKPTTKNTNTPKP